MHESHSSELVKLLISQDICICLILVTLTLFLSAIVNYGMLDFNRSFLIYHPDMSNYDN